MLSAGNIQDMVKDSASEPQVTRPSEVASFYEGRNVLLTGGTGFLGKLLIERILRSCPNVNSLFLLVREKKGKSPTERLRQIFDDLIFNRLRAERPEFFRKIVLIEGDVAQVGLGLSPENRELLRSTQIAIHGAATVRFDEKLRIAADINVRGTQELLSLAKEMDDLKAFVHISTAYSNCVFSVIEEKFYPPPMDSDALSNLLHIMNDASLEYVTPVLIGKWPNTYAFTKAIAEDTIRRNGRNLPLCIVRPSMVIATSKEPIVGWINNVYGPTGIMVAGGIGLLHTMLCDKFLVADIIPADYVVNNVIVAAWDIAKAHDQMQNIEEPPIYNIVSSVQNPITWAELMEHTEKYGIPVSSTRSIWYPYFRFNKYRWAHNLCIILFHLLPAAILDSLAWLTGRKPMLWNAYKKLHKFSSILEYFSKQQWQFCNDNVQRLCGSLCPADRNEFDLDIGNLDWEEYTYYHVRGVRVYLVKDPMDTVPQGRAKREKLKVAHYTMVTVLCGIFVWTLWLVLSFIGLCMQLVNLFVRRSPILANAAGIYQ